ncbi:hypothetical protein [Haladaptatus pallidirubidus]|uniref:Uncharacterized protein n=1 Tax=Haladaptatus pallidirubidus TaxID=1008152 RepID=A0AAV3UL29_9EURY|nr:hypothetical protein [Haladaptatus pallidirubidus]
MAEKKENLDSGRKSDEGASVTRRQALQLAGVGVGSLAVSGLSSVDVRAASNCANGPFERTYSGATVNIARLESRTSGGSAQDVGAKSPASEQEIESLRGVRIDAPGRTSNHTQSAAETGDDLSIRTEYDGVGAEGTRGGVPSDSQVAAGNGKIVHALNQQVAIFNKRSGNRQLKVELEDLFEPVIDEPEGGFAYGYPFVFDPRARYDRNADRYVIAAVQYEPGITEDGEIVDRDDQEEGKEPGEEEENESEPLQRPPKGWWCIAVSDNSNPNGKWHVYRIPPIDNEGLVDYPTLGLDRDAIYLAQNFFGEQLEVTMVTLDKEAMYDGRDVTANHFTALDNPEVENIDFTVQPALQPFSGGDDGTFYLVDSVFPSPTASALTLWEVTNPVDDPSLECFTVDVEEFAYPPTARQPDSDKRIDTLGTRLMNADYNDGSLWTAHTIQYDWNGDGAPVAAIKWYEIDTDTREVVQSGVYGEPDRSYFIPTVGSDGDSTVITHNVSGPDTFPRMDVAGRTADYTPNGLEDSLVVQDGESRYDYGEGEEVMRWGDYNGVSVDPTTGRFWTVSQYSPDIDIDPDAEERDPYHTRIAEISFD